MKSCILSLISDEKGGESSTTNNWGATSFIEKPFKKKSPSPPVVAMPRRTKTNNQPAGNQKPKGQNTPSSKPSKKSRSSPNRRSLSSVSSISSNDLSDSENKGRKKYFEGNRKRDRSPVFRGRNLPYYR